MFYTLIDTFVILLNIKFKLFFVFLKKKLIYIFKFVK